MRPPSARVASHAQGAAPVGVDRRGGTHPPTTGHL